MTRRVLLFDPLTGGHRAQYAAAIMRAAHAFPQTSLVFALSRPVVQQTRRLIESTHEEQSPLVEIPDDISNAITPNNKDVVGGLKVLKYAEDLAEKFNIDHVFIMQLDTLLPALFVKSFLGSKVSYGGIYFRPTIHYEAAFGSRLSFKEDAFNGLKRLFMRRLLSVPTTKRLLSLDPYFDDVKASAGARSKIGPLPDLVSTPGTAVRPHDLPDSWLERPYRFVLFGAISERKGPRQLIAAISMLSPAIAAASSFLICGEVDPPFRAAFDAALDGHPRGPHTADLNTIQRFLSDEELWWLVGNCTAVLAPYQRHIGYSGVLCWAAAAQKPILTQDFGVLGWEVKQQKLGLAVDTTLPSEICAALEQICTSADGALTDRPSQIRFAETHSESEFARTLFDAFGRD